MFVSGGPVPHRLLLVALSPRGSRWRRRPHHPEGLARRRSGRGRGGRRGDGGGRGGRRTTHSKGTRRNPRWEDAAAGDPLPGPSRRRRRGVTAEAAAPGDQRICRCFDAFVLIGWVPRVLSREGESKGISFLERCPLPSTFLWGARVRKSGKVGIT